MEDELSCEDLFVLTQLTAGLSISSDQLCLFGFFLLPVWERRGGTPP